MRPILFNLWDNRPNHFRKKSLNTNGLLYYWKDEEESFLLPSEHPQSEREINWAWHSKIGELHEWTLLLAHIWRKEDYWRFGVFFNVNEEFLSIKVVAFQCPENFFIQLKFGNVILEAKAHGEETILKFPLSSGQLKMNFKWPDSKKNYYCSINISEFSPLD